MYHQGIHFGDSGFSTVNCIHPLFRIVHKFEFTTQTSLTQLRRYAEAAAKQGISLIILPCHKSHIDYLVIRYHLP